ncbi:MAG: DUF6352 family protein [Pseudolabrys sp.]
MKDFWISCGHHLLDRDEGGGGLLLTDDFLKVYMARPELIPPPDACDAERALHAALRADPRMKVVASDIAAIADADARENWQQMIAFRDHLLRHKTLEAAYIDLVRQGLRNTPILFVNQLVHVIMRNALDGIEDASVVRAAEMFYRTQRVTLHEGSLIAADEEKVGGVNPASVSPLVSMLGLPAEAHIHVIKPDNAGGYWGAQRPIRHGHSWIKHCARRRRHHRAAHRNARGQPGLVCRARHRRHQDRRSDVERRGDRRSGHGPCGRLVPTHLPRPLDRHPTR